MGAPIYNPAGKYVVKLFINGCWRAVTIDDYFPRSKHGHWSCSYSKSGKLWVSLIEKAYLKLHGGYDFPGSNSSRDLYVLTGWLPQTHKIKNIDF
jgi:calpain-7